MNTMQFWETRAQRFAAEGEGLRAVCSYAMPQFYNWSIDLSQRYALNRILDSIRSGSNVLDFGCGVGRWTRELARRGAQVTAVDFSATMLAEARRRTALAGLTARCRFIQSDIADVPLQKYDVIVGVTVLQHVLGDEALGAVVARFARALKPGGRLILVEAMPLADYRRCDTPTFRARTLASYVTAVENAGLKIVGIDGIDPAPFKLWVVPHFGRWPKPVGLVLLAVATLLSLPFDLLLARVLTRHSWHKTLVAVAP